MSEVLTVPARFRGPPQSGNGGYVAGLVAELLNRGRMQEEHAAVEFTLQAPTPLDRPAGLISPA